MTDERDKRAVGCIYNVCDLRAFTEGEWVQQIARVNGWKGEVVALPSGQLPPSLRREMFDFTQQYEVDSTRIRRELGYTEIVPFAEALRRTMEWERTNPPEQISPEDFDYAAEDAALAASTFFLHLDFSLPGLLK